MMLFWELFTVFFKIGLFSFGGGLAMISIIQQEIVGCGWIPAAEYARIITISQITPGPIAVNTATYVGARVCGPEFWHALLGSFVATFSVSLPSFILVAIVARSLQKFNSSPAVQGILNGLRPSVIALMLTAVFFFYADNILSRSRNRRNGKSADLFQILADLADGFAFLSALLP